MGPKKWDACCPMVLGANFWGPLLDPLFLAVRVGPGVLVLAMGGLVEKQSSSREDCGVGQCGRDISMLGGRL